MSQGLCGDMPIYHIISKLSVYQWPYNEVLKLRLQEALADLLNFSTDICKNGRWSEMGEMFDVLMQKIWNNIKIL